MKKTTSHRRRHCFCCHRRRFNTLSGLKIDISVIKNKITIKKLTRGSRLVTSRAVAVAAAFAAIIVVSRR